VPDGLDILLVEAISFLVVGIIGRDCDPPRVPLSPLLGIVGILLGNLDSDSGCHCLAAVGDCFPASWDKERPDCLLIGSVLDAMPSLSSVVYLMMSFGA
jgi:hypothetical protein